MIMRNVLFTLALAALLPAAAMAETRETSAGPVEITPIVTGLTEPWAVGFLPGGGVLITERGGRLLLAADGTVGPVSGVPKVQTGGQGGLLDILVPRDFARTNELLFTYVTRSSGRRVTALARAELDRDKAQLKGVQTLFEMTSRSTGTRHFGSRIVEGADGKIFVTFGERGDDAEAQNLASHNGTVIRLNRDGSVPSDNPFLGQPDALPEIWSYGHRNPQGAALDLNGQLLVNEHGAQGGDEVNRIEPGTNYGWPVIAYGRHYSGAKIGEGTAKPGMAQPEHYWDPSIAPSGMMVYSGKLWPAWRGDVFVGALKFDYLSRLDSQNGWSEEEIKTPETGRVRDVREGPSGGIWFLSVDNGALYRMMPTR